MHRSIEIVRNLIKEMEETRVVQKEGLKADYGKQVQRNKSLPGIWLVKKEMGYILAWKERGISGKIPFDTSATRRNSSETSLPSTMGLNCTTGIIKKSGFLLHKKSWWGDE